MLKNNKYTILSGIAKHLGKFILIFVILIPFLLMAEGTGCPDGTGDPEGTGTCLSTKIENPLGENGPSDIPQFIAKMLEIVMIVAIPIVALAIIYTGFLFVSAQGNSEALTKAKKSLLYTLIGAALLLGAFVLAEAIGKTVDEIKSTT